MASALEKKYQRIAAEAVDYAMETFNCPRDAVIISFAEHDCIVDIRSVGDAPTYRFVYLYEED